MARQRVNLLPWREDERRQQNTEFSILAGIAAVVGIVIAVAVMLFYNNLIEIQNERNSYLDGEIAVLDTRLKKIDDLKKQRASLITRMEVIKDKQSSRSQIVYLFEEISTKIPENVWLKQLDQKKNTVTLVGVSDAPARVSAYVRNLEESAYVTKPNILLVQATAEAKEELNSSQSEFQIKFDQQKPKQIKENLK